jgi:hypothetical protein
MVAALDGREIWTNKQMNMPLGADQTRLLAGLIGLVGALLFFAGDMCFYGYFGAGNTFAIGLLRTVQQDSEQRLYVGGLIGPVAACLCIAGFWHVYLNVQPQSRVVGRLMLTSFCLLMIGGSAVHTLWAAKGLAIKYCTGDDSNCRGVLAATRTYWTMVYNLSAIPGYFGAALLGYLVLAKKTFYPRWTLAANPAVLVFLSPLAVYAPAPIGSILVGGSANLSIAVFFIVSLWTTWPSSARSMKAIATPV